MVADKGLSGTGEEESHDDDGVAMEIAAMNGNCDEMRKIYQRNPQSVHHRGVWEWTPLLRAADKNQIEATKLLLYEFHADTGAVSKFGHTALHVAATKGNTKIIALLIQNGGFDINARDAMLRTPLMMVAQNGHCDSIRLLLGHGAEIDGRNSEGLKAKDIARKYGNKTAVVILEKYEVDPKAFKDACCADGCPMRKEVLNLSDQMKKMQGDMAKMKVDQKKYNRDTQNVQNQRSFVHEQVQLWQFENADRLPRQHTESICSDSTDPLTSSSASDLKFCEGSTGSDSTSVPRQNSESTDPGSSASGSSVDGEKGGASGSTVQYSPQTSVTSVTEPNISEKFLMRLANKLGADSFKSFFIELDFQSDAINTKLHGINPMKDAGLALLVDWQNKCPIDMTKDAKEKLLEDACTQIERLDLVKYIIEWKAEGI